MIPALFTTIDGVSINLAFISENICETAAELDISAVKPWCPPSGKEKNYMQSFIPKDGNS